MSVARDEGYDIGFRVGRPAVEQLLLSIIDAHLIGYSAGTDDWRVAREQRLTSARAALFGEEPSSGAKYRDDAKALLFMANERYRDRIRATLHRLDPERVPPNPQRSDRELAGLAALRFYGEVQPEAPSREFQEGKIKKRLRTKFRKGEEYWLSLVELDDGVAESIERQLVLKIITLLDQLGVPADLSSLSR